MRKNAIDDVFFLQSRLCMLACWAQRMGNRSVDRVYMGGGEMLRKKERSGQ